MKYQVNEMFNGWNVKLAMCQVDETSERHLKILQCH
jgi:hypothetical protein